MDTKKSVMILTDAGFRSAFLGGNKPTINGC